MRFKLYTVMIVVCGFIAIGTSFFMISRAYTTEIATKNEYSRDIIFCIDISYFHICTTPLVRLIEAITSETDCSANSG